MTCSSCRALVHDYLDDELPPTQRAAFEARLARCHECRKAVQAERAFVQRVRVLMRGPAAPHWLGARIAAAIAVLATDPRPGGGIAGTGWH
jgi:anti-sigma factor RsiW